MKNNHLVGRIVRIISNLCSVEVDNQIYYCKPRGKFYVQNISPMVGDIVTIDADNNYILEIKERKNNLSRPTIANVDCAIIVTSLKNPSLSLFLLDKLLTLIIHNNIKPIICFTKYDLLNEDEKKEIDKLYEYYNNIGISTIYNFEIDKLAKLIDGKIVVLTGQSGAGKSSLLNRIDPKLMLETKEISKALNRGVHTTRHTEMYKLLNAFISDTPGFSSLDLNNITKDDIRNSFIEFGNNCKFNDCYHINEKDCDVKDRVGLQILQSRYDNYLKLVSECESIRIIYKK